MTRLPTPVKLPALLLFLAGLNGCYSYSPEDMFDNYTDRLARVLEVETDMPSAPVLPLFPQRRERILDTLDLREGLLDTLRLKHCDLLPLIAQRNSSLGKVYKPSQKMIYEVKFYVGIRDCLNRVSQSDTADPELLNQLTAIWNTKDHNLPAEIWNGLYTSEALEKNFSIGEPPLPLEEQDSSTTTTLEALAVLSQLATLPNERSHWQLPASTENIETYYETLQKNRSGAKLLSALTLLTQQLQYGSDLIEKRLQRRAICFNNKASPKAKILQNVFYKYYAGEVQPYMAKVDKYAQRWFALNTQIIADLQAGGIHLPDTVTDYFKRTIALNNRNSLWSDYKIARDRHIQLWQKVLKQCGMMPSGNR